MERVKAWWHLWWDEVLTIIGVSTVLVLFIAGGWWLFQTTPLRMEEGTVVEHRFTAQYEETHDGGSTCVSYDKNGGCSFRVQNADIHHTHCVGGCYEIRVDGCSLDRRGQEHCRKEWKSVSEFMYNDCEDGSHWRREHPDCPLR
jgi:hypothetical protein